MLVMIRSLAAVLAITYLLAGCSSPASQVPSALPSRSSGGMEQGPEGHPPTGTIPAVELGTPLQAASRLRSLRPATRDQPWPPYSRRAFGDSWSDTDGNGCNQRDDVLLRDGVPGTVLVVQQGRCDHDVVAGTWIDPYTGNTLTFDNLKDLAQAEAVQIDHVVPLAEAWFSGAAAWTADRRRRFANDLSALIAADGPTNASKGADDPAAWRPKKPFQCRYAVRWIDIKTRWDLAVDDSERKALASMLALCSDE